MKFRIKKWNQLSTAKKAFRIIDIVAIFYLVVLGSFVVRAEVTAKTNTERLFLINSPLLFKVLNPTSGNALGATLPFVNIGFLNRSKIDELNENIDNIRRHEAKHLEQFQTLGPIKAFQLENWKSEGIAEYARGSSTIDICATTPVGTEAQLDYREYHTVVKYLIESEKLTEEDIYALDSYPLKFAQKWVAEKHCTMLVIE
ncbi:hypothetical protein FE810_13115 [Thalassotalea litorea]|uniref:Uncharacterized protein n=1 Tax=Thalassotalea litorea TaxID=2020715 RepID=A0A5R9IEG0_9GAMM|nr:hypothetical protein [Thalassotalea litorea]TLU61991.1 hypothetical protein FE810_13115 [Thalassotalea litorea]